MKTTQDLITQHLDIWTTADTEKKTGRGRASGNAGSVYGIKKLRELILELAVRGKLVPQDANDEPAIELLKSIQAEKAKLIAEGKIKKDKPLSPISNEEKPFTLPRGWEWTRLGEVCSYIQRGKGPDYVERSDISVISQKCVRWSGLDLSQARFIDSESFSKYEAIRMLREGDLLWNSTGTGTIGRACIVHSLDTEQALVVDSHVTIVRPIALESIFLWRWIQSPSVQSNIEGVASGTTNQIELNTSTVISHTLPLPPLAEQLRIVAKVDELMALCDQLETQHSNAAEAHEKLVIHLLGTLTQSQKTDSPLCQRGAGGDLDWQRIAAHFDTLFSTESSIDALKQTLLQLAVMGKLVPQDPNDKPASALLKRKGTFSEVEMPFHIPSSWSWARVDEIAQTRLGKMLDSAKNKGTPVRYLRNINVRWFDFELTDVKEMRFENSELEEFALRCGDVLICEGGYPGRAAVWDEREANIYFQKAIHRVRFQNGINPHYFVNVLRESADSGRLNSYFTGAGIQHFTGKGLMSFLVALPPIAEQHRIVAKVDELMTLCDQLKTRITQSNQLQQKLADLVVEQSNAKTDQKLRKEHSRETA